MDTITIDAVMNNARAHAQAQDDATTAAARAKREELHRQQVRNFEQFTASAEREVKDIVGRADLTVISSMEQTLVRHILQDHYFASHFAREVLFQAPEGTQYVVSVHDRRTDIDSDTWTEVAVRVGTCCDANIDLPLYRGGNWHEQALMAVREVAETGVIPAAVHTCKVAVPVEEPVAAQPKRSWVSRMLGR